MAAAAEKKRWIGTGRRKSAVARVYLTEGTGNFVVNGRTVDDYFYRPTARMTLMQPLVLTETQPKLDVQVNVCGGGQMGQAGAVRHGISRALLRYDHDMRSNLKKAGLLTRDSRGKERKKYGQPGARKRYQFSKR